MNRPLQAEKSAVRSAVAARLAALSPAQKRAASVAVCARLEELAEWQEMRARGFSGRSVPGVLMYVAGEDEVDLGPVAAQVARLALPRVTDWAKGEMDAAWVQSLDVAPAGELEVTRHGVRQPVAGCGAADLAQIDLCVVPGRAFDKLCNRLGRGGGFYDVLLRRAVFAGRGAGRRPVLVGVCFDEQVVERVPVDALDEPLDIVVTPTAVYRRM